MPRQRLPCNTEGLLPGPGVYWRRDFRALRGADVVWELQAAGTSGERADLQQVAAPQPLPRMNPQLFLGRQRRSGLHHSQTPCKLNQNESRVTRASGPYLGSADLCRELYTCGVQLSTESRDLFFSQWGQITGPTNQFPKTERSPGLAEFLLYARLGGVATILQDRFYFHFIDL